MPQQRNELIRNWGKYFGNESDDEIEEKIIEIERNHFFDEFAENPYMLSVIASDKGKKSHEVTKEFIQTLSRCGQTGDSGSKG